MDIDSLTRKEMWLIENALESYIEKLEDRFDSNIGQNTHPAADYRELHKKIKALLEKDE